MLVKEPVIFSDSGSRGERRASGVFAGFVFRELMGGDGAGGGIGHVRADGDVIDVGAGGDSGTENTVSKATRSTNEKLAWIRNHYSLESSQQVVLNQVHGSEVLSCSAGGEFDGYDAAVTSTRNLMLTIRVADCAAVLLYDSVHGVIGALHAGWRGAVAGIVPKTVGAMRALGAEAKEMRVYVSPSISASCFEVGEEVAKQFPEAFVYRSFGKKPHVDLKSFLQEQCLQLGIPHGQIEVDKICSMTDRRCESYRRDGADAGRMVAFLALQSE